MTFVNMNPHMPTQHTRPGEGPHPTYNGPSGPRHPDRLADQLSQLHIQQDRPREARQRSFDASAELDEDTDLFYIGYTFFKAPAAPGRNANWLKADKTRMNLDQDQLSNLVQKKAKRKAVADQYQDLKRIRRTHVDDLIEELRENNPQYQWTCVYVKEEERNVRGKGYPRNSWETSSMNIIIQGKALNPSSFRVRPRDNRDTFYPRDPRDQRPILTPQHSSDESRPFSRADFAEQWRGPGVQQAPNPPHVHGAQQPSVHFHQQAPPQPQSPPHVQPQTHAHAAQQPSVQFHQQGPPHPQQPPHFSPQPHVQVPPHIQTPPQHRAGEPVYPQQANWAQNGPAGHAQRPQPQPVVHNHMQSAPVRDARPGVQDQRPRGPVREPESRNHRQEVPNQKPTHKQQVKAEKKRDKSPKQAVGSEPDLVYDTTSSDDDNILTPDYDGEDWETEFSERDAKASKAHPFRGSLYRGHSSSQPRRAYRQHYRKDPQRVDDHRARRYQDDGTIEVIPSSSSRSSKRMNRMNSGYRGMHGQYEHQPKVIQQQQPRISADDLELLLNQFRGHAHNSARGRMLNVWESELAEREEILKYHEQMAARYDDNNYLARHRPLRQPLTAYPHPQGYLQYR
ncbi:hypothetical protein BJX64DRAFT_208250 [Aspergillus heterothallicus]